MIIAEIPMPRSSASIVQCMIEKKLILENVRGQLVGIKLIRIARADMEGKLHREIKRLEAELNALDDAYQEALVSEGHFDGGATGDNS